MSKLSSWIGGRGSVAAKLSPGLGQKLSPGLGLYGRERSASGKRKSELDRPRPPEATEAPEASGSGVLVGGRTAVARETSGIRD
ncbi:hypothetical protein CTAM01_14694 [Colletotrichum tamarilloi]|uniref:Uncharacterized protein n=1 Tax=Colletotrichum tamarilloi TaxID=1209934 RepID=A0ABQ9QNM9_9PEZI|nr:uncharacterized protein CTAM01_14694 [Colletotrichum tamarilloi]KAK1479347.1 hypothetical protein CTAM01_14694 [Colletotrichum tamarilloi]